MVFKSTKSQYSVFSSMFKSKYDTEITTWTPEGHLLQLEYATKAVKQGSPVIAIRNSEAVVFCYYNNKLSKLAEISPKSFKIGNHLLAVICGITSDGVGIVEYIRNSNREYQYEYGKDIPIQDIVTRVGWKANENTAFHGRTPFGAEVVLGGFDATGMQLYSIRPDSENFSYNYICCGGRDKGGEVYLKKFAVTTEELKDHALKAIYHQCCSADEVIPEQIKLEIIYSNGHQEVLDSDIIASRIAEIAKEVKSEA